MKHLGSKKKFWLICLGIVCLTVFVKEKNHTYQIAGNSQELYWEDRGVGVPSASCLSVSLNKGQYHLKIDYSVEKELPWRLVDMLQNDGNNNVGMPIAEGTLNPEDTVLDVEFELDKDAPILDFEILRGTENVENLTFGTWTITLTKDSYHDWIFILAALSFGIFLCSKYEVIGHRRIAIIGLGVLLTVPFWGDFLQNGHDLWFHLARIKGITEGLQRGEFPVRINTFINNGFGSLDSIYYPNLFLYPAAILCCMGCSLLNAYKFLILGINVATGLIGYYSFRRLLKSDTAGMMCAFLYLFNPYRLLNLYLRAALGELLAAVFLPLLLYGVYEMFYGSKNRWWIVAVGATGVLNSHILTLEISFIFVAVFGITRLRNLFVKEEQWRIWNIIKASAVIIIGNFWFLVPLFLQMGRKISISEMKMNLAENTVYFPQMFQMNLSMTGGNVADGATGEMPLSIGIVLMFGVVLYIWYAYARKEITGYFYKLGNICLFFGGVACYMASNWFPWKWVQENEISNAILGVIQYPWRFLGFANLFLTVVVGCAWEAIYRDRKKYCIYLMNGLTLWTGILCMESYVKDLEPVLKGRNQSTVSPAYVDYYTPEFGEDLLWNERCRVRIEGDVNIEGFQRHGADLEMSYFDVGEDSKGNILHFPLYNYDIYKIYLNGESLPYYSDENSLVTVELPEGVQEGKIYIQYVTRKIYRAADCVTLMFMLGMATIGAKNRFFCKKSTLRKREESK